MKIAFLSSLNPYDINNWSGTLYYIFQSLKKSHEVEWVEENIYREVYLFHQVHYGESRPFVPEAYALLFGKLLSERLSSSRYDLIVARDYFYIAYLKVDIPLVYIGDTTFRLYNSFLKREDSDFVRLADETERRAISRADVLLYSSQWAKESAINDYGASRKKAFVVEFGANIDGIPVLDLQSLQDKVCNLLFIGKNWVYKGGEKALAAYQLLKERGLNCKLSIIGARPDRWDESDPDITIIPFLDKSQQSDREKFYQILSEAHFFILPTVFDCFGIVFCEAAAYGVPSLTADVGGVSQVIREGKNGFLLPEDATPGDYADKIQMVFEDQAYYRRLRRTARIEFEKRLNWEVWAERVNKLFCTMWADRQDGVEEEEGFYIPVYVINMKERKERKEHIKKEFRGKEEFQVAFVEACEEPIGAVGLWKSMVKVVKLAIERDDDVIIICEDDHFFTEAYSKEKLFRNIMEAHEQGVDVLSGGIGGFGTAVPVARDRYWVDWFWCTQFIVVYRKFYHTILEYDFREYDTADGVISALANSMTLYPFISMQKDFGYSDVTRSNDENSGMIVRHFASANERLAMIHRVAHYFGFKQGKDE